MATQPMLSDELDDALAEAIDNAPQNADASSVTVKGRGSKKGLAALIPSIWQESATYPKEPKFDPTLVEQTLHAFFIDALNGAAPAAVALVGQGGTGKSAFVLGMSKLLAYEVEKKFPGKKLDVIFIPMTTATPEDMVIIGVGKNAQGESIVQSRMYQRFSDPATVKILFFDEPNRASGEVRNQLLEVIQEKRLGDMPIPNVMLIVGAMNMGRGYAVQKMDYALASRWTATLEVGRSDTPWKLALANTYPEQDLGPMYTTYERLKDLDEGVPEGNPRLLDVISPRTLEHIVWNLNQGNPAVWAVPHLDATPLKVLDASGKDLMPEALNRLADALGLRNPETRSSKLLTVLDQAWNFRKNVQFISNPGGGKTSAIRAWAAQRHPEATCIVLNGASTNMDQLFLQIMDKDGNSVEIALLEILRQPGEKLIVLDDIWRADGVTRAKFMELLQEGTIGGIPIPGLRMVLALSNPRTLAGMRQDVGKPDLAQADRFFANVILSEDDLLAAEHLLSAYGEEAAAILDWRDEDLDDTQRELLNFRIVESLIRMDALGLPIENALPLLGEKRIPVPLHELRRRLDDRPAARIRSIAENVDTYVDYIERGSLSHGFEVAGALRRAQGSQLATHVDAVIKLMKALQKAEMESIIMTLYRQGGDRLMFWLECLKGDAEAATKWILKNSAK